MLSPKQTDLRNGILAGIPEQDFQAIRPRLEWVKLKPGTVLEQAGAPAKFVYFVDTGVISLLAPLEHGGRMEIGHVGREGAAGVHAALGADTSTSEVMAQSDGFMFRADVAAVRQILEQSRGLHHALVRFANALHVQVSQTAACNGSHEVAQRLARWLLMAHDRIDGDTLDMTHEAISLMLGVTRPGVTIAAGTLQKAGLIQYSRGHLTIVDRIGLEQAACECYKIVAAYYLAELGPTGRR
jgi:CRP-like cAMP-binding protein